MASLSLPQRLFYYRKEHHQNGWPVLAWAHGTTGVADTCAPSGDYAGGPVHSYQEVASKR